MNMNTLATISTLIINVHLKDLRTVLLSQDALSGLAIHTLQQLVESGYPQQLLYIFLLQFVISCTIGYCT